MLNRFARWFPALVVFLSVAVLGAAGESGPGAAPPPPQLTDPSRAPQTARLLKEIALKYEPKMRPEDRDRDFLEKIARVKSLLKVKKLVELRRQSLEFFKDGREVSWEYLRRRRGPGGDQVGVTLAVPVWAPARARRVTTYCGFEKKWQTVAQSLPRPCGYVWFAPILTDINNKASYRPARIEFEVNSRFAPLAALFLEYIFREGYYDPAKRVPLLVVRSGEDSFAASAASGPVEAECLSFTDEEGSDMAHTVHRGRYDSLAAIFHGHHSSGSNHRLGLALDLNDFNFTGVKDGPPNPISRALRQYNRDAMHRADARNAPAWVYRAAKWLGMRLPQEWVYFGYHTDWEHVDVGTK